jgi:Peptidase inhibitor family I36
MTTRTLRLITLTLVLLTGSLLAAGPATADDTPDPRITAALAEHSGGEVIDAHTAYWPDEHMTLHVDNPLLRVAVGNCPNGSICAFSGTNIGGSRISWTTCGTYNTSTLGAPVKSIADARSTGSLQARSGTTVLATAIAQSWDNVTGTTDNVRCL